MSDVSESEKGKTGRPPKKFDREQIDAAKRYLGRLQYPSRVNTQLRRKFPDLTVARAYKLIDLARREVVESFAGDGSDPLAAVYTLFLSVMANPKEKTRDRLEAANGAARLLGLNKLIKTLQDAGDVDEYLAGVLSRRAARAGEKPAEPKPEVTA